MTKDEALKLALEALIFAYYEDKDYNDDCQQKVNEARQAIREALAQPEHEPHSWYSAQEDEFMTHKTRKEHERLNSYTHKVGKFDLALYTISPHRKPLTDEEIDKLPWEPHEGNPMTFAEGLRYFARAIEAAHGIKD